MVYLKYVENVITLGKLIGLLFLFCLPLLYILFFKTKRNDLARPVKGTIFLVGISTDESHREEETTTRLHMFIRSHSNSSDQLCVIRLAHISWDCSYLKNELTDITVLLGRITLQCHSFSPNFEDDCQGQQA